MAVIDYSCARKMTSDSSDARARSSYYDGMELEAKKVSSVASFVHRSLAFLKVFYDCIPENLLLR